jgi:hypothetical protein
VPGTVGTRPKKAVRMPNTEIALVGEGGQPLGSKPRSDITADDTYHSVFVLVVTPQKQLLLRKLSSGSFSATGMTICLAGESSVEAAQRATPWAQTLHHLGDQFYALPKQKTYTSVYYAVAPFPENAPLTPLGAEEISEHALTPALARIWEQFRHLLPVA